MEKPDPWDRTASSWPGVLSLCAVTYVRGYLRSMPIGRGSREQTETGNTMPAAKEKRAMTRQDVAFVLGGEGGDPLSGHRRW